MIDKITIYFPYYNQPTVLEFVLKNYLKFSKEIREKINILIVDDGSEIFPAIDVINKFTNLQSELNITLYRITIDIKWNQPEANNLAISKIETEYFVRLDIDHFFDETNIKNLLKLNPQKNEFYSFNRISVSTNNEIEVKRPHPNSYLMSKKNYDIIGGYNEYFCGNYGDDIDFLPRAEKILKRVLLNNVTINVLLWGGTKNLSRDLSINREKLKDNQRPFLKFQHKDNYIKQI
jgi:hypothetical protein